MADVIEKTDEKIAVTNDGDHDRFQHYFPLKEIDANLMFGSPMKALCGKIVKQQVDPQGRPVCQRCKEIYEEMWNNG